MRDELPPELQAELDALANRSDDSIDTDDIPEAPRNNMLKGERGRFYRPMKTPVTIRLDADLVEWFKTNSKNGKYQTEINRALRLYMQEFMKRAS